MEKEIAKVLLSIKAVKLSPLAPFTWASGWQSPIYCDNRTILSFVEQRRFVAKAFAELIKVSYPDCEMIAGVATGAIAWGVLAAEELGLPAIYVRSSAKDHGLSNQVEGSFKKGQKVVVVEDLISTGGSSLAAVEALRGVGVDVLGMTAIFTYGFDTARDNFIKAHVKLNTLSNYEVLISEALGEGYVDGDQVEALQRWRTSPQTWGK